MAPTRKRGQRNKHSESSDYEDGDSSFKSSRRSSELRSLEGSSQAEIVPDTANDAAIALQLAESAMAEGRPKRQCTLRPARNHRESGTSLASDDKPSTALISKYDFNELLAAGKYHYPELVRKMEPEDFTLEYYARSGLNEVLLFDCKPEKLGMKMVDDDFNVHDVQRLVGANQEISVVEVSEQADAMMNVGDFQKYYHKDRKERGTLFNVLSLEYSLTGMEDMIESPSLVREVDWMKLLPDWERQRIVTFNSKGEFSMNTYYPKVANYCLMSVEKCFTDFHIDFHGTSVWYHVKKGKKIFWIIEPTDQNVLMYEEHHKHMDQAGFFGDVPDRCHRVELQPGNTLIIPSGWIHAVYTPEDSLVFGGNFLHTRAVDMQFRVVTAEFRIGVNKKFRMPYAEKLYFYVLADLVKKITGREYVRPGSRNVAGKEYCGRLFRETGHHKNAITKEAYTKEGCLLNPIQWDEAPEFYEFQKMEAIRFEEDEKKKLQERSKNVDSNGFEMEAESDEDGNGRQPKEEVKEDEMDTTFDDDAEKPDKLHYDFDDFFYNDTTFYHPERCNCDPPLDFACDFHTWALTPEPEMHVDLEKLRELISVETLLQLEVLVIYIMKKKTIEIPYGLTRSNSLINCTRALLLTRREQLAKEGIELEPTKMEIEEPKQKKAPKATRTQEELDADYIDSDTERAMRKSKKKAAKKRNSSQMAGGSNGMSAGNSHSKYSAFDAYYAKHCNEEKNKAVHWKARKMFMRELFRRLPMEERDIYAAMAAAHVPTPALKTQKAEFSMTQLKIAQYASDLYFQEHGKALLLQTRSGEEYGRMTHAERKKLCRQEFWDQLTNEQKEVYEGRVKEQQEAKANACIAASTPLLMGDGQGGSQMANGTREEPVGNGEQKQVGAKKWTRRSGPKAEKGSVGAHLRRFLAGEPNLPYLSHSGYIRPYRLWWMSGGMEEVKKLMPEASAKDRFSSGFSNVFNRLPEDVKESYSKKAKEYSALYQSKSTRGEEESEAEKEEEPVKAEVKVEETEEPQAKKVNYSICFSETTWPSLLARTNTSPL